VARKPRSGRGGKSTKKPRGTSARSAQIPSGESHKARVKPPIRDLDQLEIEKAHASGEFFPDLVLDEDDELTQWQDDPHQNKAGKRKRPTPGDGEAPIELDDDSLVPADQERASRDSFASDDDLDDELDNTVLSDDAEPASKKSAAGPPRPARTAAGKPLPRAPLVNPFSQEAETSKPRIYFDHSGDPDEEAAGPDGAPVPPDIKMEDDVQEIQSDSADESLLLDDEPPVQPSRMDLVHVSMDPDDPDRGFSIDEEMETDLLDLTPAGTSYDELERLENQVERLEEEDRLDEALSTLRQLQRLLPAESELQYRYEELQHKVIQSYFPGKNRDSVVHLSVETQELPGLIKKSEAELGSLLGRMDGATALGDLDQALGDMQPGTLYRLLSRAKGKGLIRLE